MYSRQQKKTNVQSPTGKTAGDKAAYLTDNRKQDSALQRKPNNTGLPDNLKSGIENLSGHSMDDVKVHYNSSAPAQLNAHAYAQGTSIHLAPGQEKHLPHEAWHVVQQKQGRVKPTMQLKGKVNVNDDSLLEKEADVMGGKAMQFSQYVPSRSRAQSVSASTVQLKVSKEQSKHLSEGMANNFAQAYEKFKPVLEQSPINNYADIVVRGWSNAHLKEEKFEEPDQQSFKGTLATTLLWIGDKEIDSDEQLEEIWYTKREKFPEGMTIKLMITINMSGHRAISQLYATLLHEWYAHGQHWANDIREIHEGKGKTRVKEIQDKTSVTREAEEHMAYANYSADYVKQLVQGLNLGKEEQGTINKLEKDVLSYDPNTGDRLNTPRKRPGASPNKIKATEELDNPNQKKQKLKKENLK